MDDPYVAADYALRATWMGDDQSIAFERALERLSKRRLSRIASDAVPSADMVEEFEKDNLDACELFFAYRKVRKALDALDKRGAELSQLAASKPWHPREYQATRT